jgi:hypothetical protein
MGSVTAATPLDLDLMAKQHTGSHHSHRPRLVAEIKARQSAKIREIAEVLVEAGLVGLDAQARALGVCRSTAWTILKSSHKSSGLSAKIVSRILAERGLPTRVRAKILEYVEEKASGRYGHSAKIRRKFITALSIRLLEDKKILRKSQTEMPNEPESRVIVSALHRPAEKPSAKSESAGVGRKPRRIS